MLNLNKHRCLFYAVLFLIFLTNSIYSNELFEITNEDTLNLNLNLGDELNLDFKNYNPNHVVYQYPFDDYGYFKPESVGEYESKAYLFYENRVDLIYLNINVEDKNSSNEKSFTTETKVPVIHVTELDTIKIDLDSLDLDDDDVELIYFEPLNNKGEWKTNIGDKGNYSITIGVNDGTNIVKKNISIIVEENKNYVLNDYKFNINAKNGQVFDFSFFENKILSNLDKIGYLSEIKTKFDDFIVTSDNHQLNITITNNYYDKKITFDFNIYPEESFILELNNSFEIYEGNELRIKLISEEYCSRFEITTNYGQIIDCDLVINPETYTITHNFMNDIARFFNSDYVLNINKKVRLTFSNQYDFIKKSFNLKIYDLNIDPIFISDEILINETEKLNLVDYVADYDGDRVKITQNYCDLDINKKLDHFSQGNYQCSFNLSDDYTQKEHIININVINKNRKPFFENNIKSNYKIDENNTLFIDFVGNDNDQEELSYSYNVNTNISDDCFTIENINQSKLYIKSYFCASNYENNSNIWLNLSISDGIDTISKEVLIEFRDIYRKPVITGINKLNDYYLSGESIHFLALVEIFEDYNLTYNWYVEGKHIITQNPEVDFIFTKSGNKKVILEVCDFVDYTSTRWNLKVLSWHYE